MDGAVERQIRTRQFMQAFDGDSVEMQPSKSFLFPQSSSRILRKKHLLGLFSASVILHLTFDSHPLSTALYTLGLAVPLGRTI